MPANDTANLKMIVYWVKSGAKDYIGATKDFSKRIRQHNGEIKGGARCTKGRVWSRHKIVVGFHDWRECLKFEWHLKRLMKYRKDKDAVLEDFVRKHEGLAVEG